MQCPKAQILQSYFISLSNHKFQCHETVNRRGAFSYPYLKCTAKPYKNLRIVLQKQPLEVFLGKGVLKICSKFTGEHPCQSTILTKFQSNFIEITFRHGCSPVNLVHIFRIPFVKNIFGRLLLVLQHTQDSFTKLDQPEPTLAFLCHLKKLLLSTGY